MEPTSFMLHDISRALLGVGVLGLLLVAPGYVVGHVTEALSFRSRSPLTRLLIAVVLGISLCPIATYFLARPFGWGPVILFYASAGVVFLALMIRGLLTSNLLPRGHMGRYGGWALAFAAAWVCLAVMHLVDFQIGQKLYWHGLWDYVKHYMVTDAVARTGIPPLNPAFQPIEGMNGQPVHLYYYYFWHMMAALPAKLLPGLVGVRGGTIASAVWAGLGLISVVALAAREWGGAEGDRARRLALIAVLLLAVTGLDLLPTMAESLVATLRGSPQLMPFIEMWNRGSFVSAWVLAALGTPQHVAALAAASTGFLLLRQALEAPERRQAAPSLALATLSLTSACGMSAWVSMVAAAALAVYTVDLLVRRSFREAGLLVMLGVGVAVLLLPLLLDLSRSAFEPEFPLAADVRGFRPAARALERFGLLGSPVAQVVYFVCLPLNYALELGFFAFAGGAYWWSHRRGPSSENNRFLTILLVTTFLLCSFLRSALLNNDLGWRGFMFAQFALLIWSARLVDGAIGDGPFNVRELLRGWKRLTLAAMLALGVLASGYDFGLRALSIMTPRVTFGSPPHLDGEEIFHKRAAYEWVDTHTPRSAVVQANPDVWESYFQAFYTHRQSRALERNHGTLFSIRRGMYEDVATRLRPIFAGTVSPDSVLAICRQEGIDYLVLTPDDDAWDPSARWGIEPCHESDVARIYHFQRPGSGPSPP